MTAALLVVDVQNDFCVGGRLPVPGGGEVVPIINKLVEGSAGPSFETVVFTQDWHPATHRSFASAHDPALGLSPFDLVRMPYGDQVLWPDHCVQGTDGAAFHPDLRVERATLIIRKGMNPEVDSYSAFRENDKQTVTGLAGYLRDRGVDRLVIAGLALDFCVAFSAIDARELGFAATVLTGASRAIDTGGSLEAAVEAFRRNGVELLEALD